MDGAEDAAGVSLQPQSSGSVSNGLSAKGDRDKVIQRREQERPGQPKAAPDDAQRMFAEISGQHGDGIRQKAVSAKKFRTRQRGHRLQIH